MDPKEHYKITFKKKTSLTITLFLGAGIVIGSMILATIIYGLTGEPGRIKDFSIIVVLLALFIIVLVDRFLWLTRGIETLIINENIEVQKRGNIFSSKKIITFSEFESFDYGNDTQIHFWIRLYGISGGKIIINYLGRSLRIGQDISLNQAKIIVEEIDTVLYKINSDTD